VRKLNHYLQKLLLDVAILPRDARLTESAQADLNSKAAGYIDVICGTAAAGTLPIRSAKSRGLQATVRDGGMNATMKH